MDPNGNHEVDLSGPQDAIEASVTQVIGGLINSSNNKIPTGNVITDIAIGIAINNTVHSESNDDGENDEVESDDDEDPSGGKTIGWEKTGITNDNNRLLGLL